MRGGSYFILEALKFPSINWSVLRYPLGPPFVLNSNLRRRTSTNARLNSPKLDVTCSRTKCPTAQRLCPSLSSWLWRCLTPWIPSLRTRAYWGCLCGRTCILSVRLRWVWPCMSRFFMSLSSRWVIHLFRIRERDECISPQKLFAITPLNWTEWQAVLLISAPVLVIDEVLKLITVCCSWYL